MSEFSSTEAAFEGLRVTRERPTAVLWWWAAYIVVTLIEFVVALQPPFKRLAGTMETIRIQSDLVQQNPADPVASRVLLGELGQAAGPFVLFAALMLILRVVLSTAVLRAVLRPADGAFGYLRLSMDEARQLGLALIACFAFILYAFLVSLVSGLVLGVVGGLMGGAPPTGVLGVLAFVILGVAFLYPAVRLSLAPAMTFADGRISFLRAWALTEGRFWPLLGGYVLAWLIGLVVFEAATVLTGVTVSIVSGKLVAEEPQRMIDLLTPASVIALVLKGLFSALVAAIGAAPIASAFRQISGRVGAPPPPRPTSGSPWGQA